MRTKWKDVAHLYVGCEIKAVKQIGWTGSQKIHTFDWLFMAYYGFDRIDKPILRRIESLSEQELEKVREIENVFDAATSTACLLALHVDLFGLIDSGQAIDASTIHDTTQVNQPKI